MKTPWTEEEKAIVLSYWRQYGYGSTKKVMGVLSHRTMESIKKQRAYLLYPETKARNIASQKTPSAVANRATYRKRITKAAQDRAIQKHQPWLPCEDELLQDYTKSSAELAKALGRTPNGIYYRRRILRKQNEIQTNQ